MPKLNQKGAVQFIVLIILLIGIAGGVFLATRKESFKIFPKASLGINIMFVDDSGNPITSTTSSSVKVKAVSPDWPQPTLEPTPTVSPSPTPSPTPPSNRNPGSTRKPKPTRIPSVKGETTTTSPVTTVNVVLAEDPSFTVNLKTLPFTTEPIIYPFSSSDPGLKTLYAKFISSIGTEQNANPFPITITLIAPSPTPSPIPAPSPTVTISPDSTHKFGTLTITWSGIPNPNKYDFMNGGGFITFYIQNSDGKCSKTPAAEPTLKSSGSCTLDLYPVVGMGAGGDTTLKLYSGDPAGPFGRELATANSFYLDAEFRGVFITSTNYRGDLGGLDGADAKCTERARAGNLGGKWVAWLSDWWDLDGGSTPWTRIQDWYDHETFKRLDGITIANNWGDLTDGSIQAPILVTELRDTLDSKYAWDVWTGTGIDGRWSRKGDDCYRWSKRTDSYTGSIGTARSVDGKWTDDDIDGCFTWAKLYCFETK